MSNITIFFRVLLCIWVGSTQILASTVNSCCLEFQNKICTKCPSGTHLFRGNCIFDIQFCQKYQNGFDCIQCSEGYQIEEAVCVPNPTQSQAQEDADKKNSTQGTVLQLENKTLQVKPESITVINIADPEQNPSGILDEFTITDDIFRSRHPVLKPVDSQKVQVQRAQRQFFANGDIHMVIRYLKKDVDSNKVLNRYEGVMLVNLETLIFQQIDFIDLTANNEPTNKSDTQKESPQRADDQSTVNGKPQPLEPVFEQQNSSKVNFPGFNESDFHFPAEGFDLRELDFLNKSEVKMMAMLDGYGLEYYYSEEKQKLPENVDSFRLSETVKKEANTSHSQKTLQTEIEVKELEQSKIRTYLNGGHSFMILKYLTNIEDLYYYVVGMMTEMEKQEDNSSSLLTEPEIRLVYAGFDQNILNRTQPLQADESEGESQEKDSNNGPYTENTQPSSDIDRELPAFVYRPIIDETELLSNIYYVVSKDQINQEYAGLTDSFPEEAWIAEISTEGNERFEELQGSVYFRLIFQTSERLIKREKNQAAKSLTQETVPKYRYEIILRCGLDTYVAEIVSVRLKSDEENNSTENQQKGDPQPKQQEKDSLEVTPQNYQELVPLEDYQKVKNIGKLTSNIYYLIGLNALINEDRSFMGVKPQEVYRKQNMTKRAFYMKFKKEKSESNTEEIWGVSLQVTPTTFRATILEIELLRKVKISAQEKASTNEQLLQQQNGQQKELTEDYIENDQVFKNYRPGKNVLYREAADRLLY